MQKKCWIAALLHPFGRACRIAALLRSGADCGILAQCEVRLVPASGGGPVFDLRHFRSKSKNGLSVNRSLHEITRFWNRIMLILSPEIR